MKNKNKNKNKIPRSLHRLFPNVTKVSDSTVPVVVNVNAHDNKTARKGEADNCAMAHAVVRELKADGAVIGVGKSWIIKGDHAVRFTTPPLRREGDHVLRPSPRLPARRVQAVGGLGVPAHGTRATDSPQGRPQEPDSDRPQGLRWSEGA